ncbi:MAG TPA: hypothetical protein VKB43_12585 [Gaiellaceae bacterium]|nr:hypothetical protein [Gaiellaceae bacterium]
MDISLRYFGCVVGFGFGVLWMTEGIGAAILCLLLAGVGYGVVFVTERARANPEAFRLPTRTPDAETEVDDLPLRAEVEEINSDLGHVYEPSDDASSPLTAEADYGWPTEDAEFVHTHSG